MVDEWKARPERPVGVPILHVQLTVQLERLRQESTWRTSGRNAITLTKEPALRLVLMLLGKGTKISEHQAAGPLTLHVLCGSVTFRTGDCAEKLGSGELIVLESAIGHEVEALEESACLLTLAGASWCGSNEYSQRRALARTVPGQMTSQTRPEGGSSPRRTWVYVEDCCRPRTKYGEVSWAGTRRDGHARRVQDW